VVDESFFYPSLREEANEKIRFIHISTLTYEKNFEGIIQACQRLVNSSGHFEMHVIGPVTSEWRQMVKKAGLDSYILFHGEQPHEMILSFLQSADALVHYSRFETFGCVVIEALSCGIPVIVSDIPSMHELVKDGEDGVIVAGEYPDKLADVMLEFIRHPLRPNRALLHRHTVDRFGMRRVGEMFDAFYREVK
jgi:glycosyltransferase involved in cell wall biosynthesis